MSTLLKPLKAALGKVLACLLRQFCAVAVITLPNFSHLYNDSISCKAASAAEQNSRASRIYLGKCILDYSTIGKGISNYKREY